MAAVDNFFFYEDEVFRVNSKGLMQFGTVIENSELVSSNDETSDEECEGDYKMKKGHIRVAWHPSGLTEVVSENKVGLADRSLMPGDVVKRLVKEKNTQRGYCSNIKVMATVQIVGTKLVIENLPTSQLTPLAEFSKDLAVYLDHWVGVIREVHMKFLVSCSDGSKAYISDPFLLKALMIESKIKCLHEDFPRKSEFYPGQRLLAPRSILSSAQWIFKSPDYDKLAARNKQLKLSVEQMDVDYIDVTWRCTAFTGNSTQPCLSPRESIVKGDDLKRLRVLNHFESCTMQVGDRVMFTPTSRETILPLDVWRERKREHMLASGVPLPVHHRRKHSRRKTKKLPSWSDAAPDEQLAVVAQPELDSTLIGQDLGAHVIGESVSDRTIVQDAAGESTETKEEQVKPGGDQDVPAIHFELASEGESEDWDTENSPYDSDYDDSASCCTTETSSVASSSRLSESSTTQLPAHSVENKEENQSTSMPAPSPPVKRRTVALATRLMRRKNKDKQRVRGKKATRLALLKGGDEMNNVLERHCVVEILCTQSSADVVWQDGTIEQDISSMDLYPIHYLDEKEFFPGDFVVDEKVLMGEYGVVRQMDHVGRTAKIQWFVISHTDGDSPRYLGEKEMSVYDIKDHPDFQFRPGSVVMNMGGVPSGLSVNNESDSTLCDSALAKSGRDPVTEEEEKVYVGQVLDNFPEGRIKVYWVDGSITSVWPQDLYKIGDYNSEEGELWATSSEDSWETDDSLFDGDEETDYFSDLATEENHQSRVNLESILSQLSSVGTKDATPSAPSGVDRKEEKFELKLFRTILKLSHVLDVLQKDLESSSGWHVVYHSVLQVTFMNLTYLDKLLGTNLFEIKSEITSILHSMQTFESEIFASLQSSTSSTHNTSTALSEENLSEKESNLESGEKRTEPLEESVKEIRAAFLCKDDNDEKAFRSINTAAMLKSGQLASLLARVCSEVMEQNPGSVKLVSLVKSIDTSLRECRKLISDSELNQNTAETCCKSVQVQTEDYSKLAEMGCRLAEICYKSIQVQSEDHIKLAEMACRLAEICCISIQVPSEDNSKLAEIACSLAEVCCKSTKVRSNNDLKSDCKLAEATCKSNAVISNLSGCKPDERLDKFNSQLALSKITKEWKLRLNKVRCEPTDPTTNDSQSGESSNSSSTVVLHESGEIASEKILVESDGPCKTNANSCNSVSNPPNAESCNSNLPNTNGCESDFNLPDANGCHSNLPDANGCHSNLPDANGCHSNLPDANGCHSNLPDANGCHSNLPDASGCESGSNTEADSSGHQKSKEQESQISPSNALKSLSDLTDSVLIEVRTQYLRLGSRCCAMLRSRLLLAHDRFIHVYLPEHKHLKLLGSEPLPNSRSLLCLNEKFQANMKYFKHKLCQPSPSTSSKPGHASEELSIGLATDTKPTKSDGTVKLIGQVKGEMTTRTGDNVTGEENVSKSKASSSGKSMKEKKKEPKKEVAKAESESYDDEEDSLPGGPDTSSSDHLPHDPTQLGTEDNAVDTSGQSLNHPVSSSESFVMLESLGSYAHKYAKRNFSLGGSQGKVFFKALRKEMSLLRSSLPAGIWVRGFEDRLDLLSVMIEGPRHTPYEDGLFYFDFQLPVDYPNSPPLCHYISYCTDRLNPNLYETGKVCVSLLGTWSGRGTEVWTSQSTLLQLLISIQGLILNSEPYYNEAGYERQRSSQHGQENARMYNELVLLKLVTAMTASRRQPPAVWAGETRKHFRARAGPFADRLEYWLRVSGEMTRETLEQGTTKNAEEMQGTTKSAETLVHDECREGDEDMKTYVNESQGTMSDEQEDAKVLDTNERDGLATREKSQDNEGEYVDEVGASSTVGVESRMPSDLDNRDKTVNAASCDNSTNCDKLVDHKNLDNQNESNVSNKSNRGDSECENNAHRVDLNATSPSSIVGATANTESSSVNAICNYEATSVINSTLTQSNSVATNEEFELPQFPLLPASRGFCLTLMSLIGSFRKMMQFLESEQEEKEPIYDVTLSVDSHVTEGTVTSKRDEVVELKAKSASNIETQISESSTLESNRHSSLAETSPSNSSVKLAHNLNIVDVNASCTEAMCRMVDPSNTKSIIADQSSRMPSRVCTNEKSGRPIVTEVSSDIFDSLDTTNVHGKRKSLDHVNNNKI